MTWVQPIIYSIRDALVECEGLTEEQGKVFLNSCERIAKEQHEREMEEIRAHYQRAKEQPWYKRILHV